MSSLFWHNMFERTARQTGPAGGGGGGLLKIQQTEGQTRQQTGDTDWTQGVMINY